MSPVLYVLLIDLEQRGISPSQTYLHFLPYWSLAQRHVYVMEFVKISNLIGKICLQNEMSLRPRNLEQVARPYHTCGRGSCLGRDYTTIVMP